MNDALLSEMQAASLEKQNLNEENLGRLEGLVDRQLIAEARIKGLKEEAEAANAEMKEVSQRLLPDLMSELGLKKIETRKGASLEIKPYYSAKIPDGGKEDAFKWLKENGHGGIIKTGIQILLDPKDPQIGMLIETLQRLGIPYEADQTVHPQTLKAFVKEQVEEGASIPLELFGAFVGQVAKIKEKK